MLDFKLFKIELNRESHKSRNIYDLTFIYLLKKNKAARVGSRANDTTRQINLNR